MGALSLTPPSRTDLPLFDSKRSQCCNQCHWIVYGVGDLDVQAGDSSRPVRPDSVSYMVLVPHQDRCPEVLGRHECFRFLSLPGEIELLNLLCLVSVAVPDEQIVVEVLADRAHASDVERHVRAFGVAEPLGLV